MGWKATGGNDADAIHDNVASEISAITEKVTPIDADLVIIEDSAAANVKKRVQVGNLPGGGAAADSTNAPLYDTASYVDVGFSDEFDAGTLDAQWTALFLVSGTVDPIVANPADSVYDLATRSGSLLIQLDPSDDGQTIRVDDVLDDGEEVVVAMSLANIGDNPQVGNSLHAGIGFNDNDAGWTAGTEQALFWDGGNDHRVIWGTAGATGSHLLASPADGWTYWRIVRDGTNFFPFFSKNLRTWTPFPVLAMGSSDNFWVFWDTNAVAFDHAPIVEVAYVRHTDYVGLDPEWVT